MIQDIYKHRFILLAILPFVHVPFVSTAGDCHDLSSYTYKSFTNYNTP